jgi:hypothetical protein
MNHLIETPIDTPFDDNASIDDVFETPIAAASVSDESKYKHPSAIGGRRPFVVGCELFEKSLEEAALLAVKEIERDPKHKYKPLHYSLHDCEVIPLEPREDEDIPLEDKDVLLEGGANKYIPRHVLVYGPQPDKSDVTRRDTGIWKRSGIPNPFRTVQAKILRDYGFYLVDESDCSKSSRTVIRLYAQLPKKPPSLWHRLDRVPGATKRAAPDPRAREANSYVPPIISSRPEAASSLPVQRAPAAAAFGGPVVAPPGCFPMLCPDGIVRFVLMSPMPSAYPRAGYQP